MESFLVNNIKSIVHLRKRHHRDNMLGLCLGAGISGYFSFPTWHDLIKRISEHREINGQGLLTMSESLTSQSQFLFHKYRQNLARDGLTSGDEIIDWRQAALGWMHIVHECLYQTAIVDDETLQSHPYVWDLIPLIKQAAMTVNYNFDDTIERMLYIYNDKNPGESPNDRGFEVVWQPSTQFRRQRGVILNI